MQEKSQALLLLFIFFTLGYCHEGHEDGSVKINSNLLNAHGILMWYPFILLIILMINSRLSWGVFAFISVVFSKFLKTELPVAWFRVHTGLNIAVGICSLIGLLCILSFTEWTFSLEDPHHILGFFVVSGMMLQMALGILSHLKYDASREKTPIWPDQIHGQLGYIVFFSALINIGLGFSMEPTWNKPFVTFLYIITVVVVFSVVVLKPKPTENYVTQEKSTLRYGKVSATGEFFEMESL